MDLDAMTTVIAVTHCPDCPFYNWNEALYRTECEFEDEGGYPRELPVIEYEVIAANRIRTHPPVPPDWCPLRGGPVVIAIVDQED